MNRISLHHMDFTAEGTEALLNPEDGGRTVRLRVAELEGLLVRMRSIGAARIAESCGWQRRLEDARESARQWTDKASIALAAGRDDLAKAAFAEARRAQDEADLLKQQIDSANPQICEFESDLARIEDALGCLRQEPQWGPSA
jgi:phage shock protein A